MGESRNVIAHEGAACLHHTLATHLSEQTDEGAHQDLVNTVVVLVDVLIFENVAEQADELEEDEGEEVGGLSGVVVLWRRTANAANTANTAHAWGAEQRTHDALGGQVHAEQADVLKNENCHFVNEGEGGLVVLKPHFEDRGDSVADQGVRKLNGQVVGEEVNHAEDMLRFDLLM